MISCPPSHPQIAEFLKGREAENIKEPLVTFSAYIALRWQYETRNIEVCLVRCLAVDFVYAATKLVLLVQETQCK